MQHTEDGSLLYVACLEEILVIGTADATVSPLGREADICTGLGDGIALNDEPEDPPASVIVEIRY